MKRLLLALICLPLIVLADGGLPNQPYIYVEGRAEVEKPADQVTLRFSLSALDLKQEVAAKGVQEQAAAVFALLDGRKISHDDVVADDIRSEREYEEDENVPGKHAKFTGYRVTRPFTVKVRDIALFPVLVNELLKLEVDDFSGIAGGLSNEKELTEKVWGAAVANARERAEKTLAPMGQQIASVYAVSPVAFPEIAPRIFGGTEALVSEAKKSVTPSDVKADEYRLRPVSVSQSVHVIFLIVPAR
jgi:uncharacterized protein YggE